MRAGTGEVLVERSAVWERSVAGCTAPASGAPVEGEKNRHVLKVESNLR
jgi:hypothetical protein